MSQLVDYSFARPNPAAIKAAGYIGAMRYISSGVSGKNLTTGERDRLLSAGLGIGLVWEDSAAKAGQGYFVGLMDGQKANARANDLGYPANCPIFYAVDYDAAAANVVPYFNGVLSAGGRPVGVYGSANVVDGIYVPYKWQTVAWSHGRVSSQIHLYQRVGGALISGTDVNDLKRPFPMMGSVTPVVNPIIDPLNPINPIDPIPLPDPLKSQEEEMLTLLTLEDGTWHLINWANATRWEVDNDGAGVQLNALQQLPSVHVLSGPQPPTILNGLKQLNI
jgi:hypothetical protein